MFAPRPNPFQQGPFMGNHPMNFNPMGFNPFEYQNQTLQEDNPFLANFFSPLPTQTQQPTPPQQQQQQSQSQSQPQAQQQQTPTPNQAQMPPFPQQFPPGMMIHPFFGPGSPIPRKPAWYQDQNGNVDFNKIGSGVQGVMGIVNQIGPIVKTFSGIFK